MSHTFCPYRVLGAGPAVCVRVAANHIYLAALGPTGSRRQLVCVVIHGHVPSPTMTPLQSRAALYPIAKSGSRSSCSPCPSKRGGKERTKGKTKEITRNIGY